jgi:DNA-binding NarL/FixJ family response regulator
MHRVLIGQFGTVARMGLRELLDGQGIEVVAEAESAEGIVSCVSEVRPDVVVIDLDDEEALDTAE